MAKKKVTKKKQAKKKAARAQAAKRNPSKKRAAPKKRVKSTTVQKKAAKKFKPVRTAVRKRKPTKRAWTLDDVKVIGDPLFLSTDQEVDQAETEFGIKFPRGYREYVTRLGDGIFGGYYVRVYPPKRILSGENNVREWRQRINEYWFWDQGQPLLSKAQGLESVIIGDTLDGDELVVHPNNTERIYVLPRYQEQAYVAGDGLLAALEWLSSAGILTEAFKQREFEPADSSKPRDGSQ